MGAARGRRPISRPCRRQGPSPMPFRFCQQTRTEHAASNNHHPTIPPPHPGTHPSSYPRPSGGSSVAMHARVRSGLPWFNILDGTMDGCSMDGGTLYLVPCAVTSSERDGLLQIMALPLLLRLAAAARGCRAGTRPTFRIAQCMPWSACSRIGARFDDGVQELGIKTKTKLPTSVPGSLPPHHQYQLLSW